MELERATELRNGRTARFAGAVAKALSLRPPCARCRNHVATRVIGGDTPRAVCAGCLDEARLDQRIEAQRAEREAMRGRGRLLTFGNQ
jgi:hypothetical protein